VETKESLTLETEYRIQIYVNELIVSSISNPEQRVTKLRSVAPFSLGCAEDDDVKDKE
jgi:hypothetical protein